MTTEEKRNENGQSDKHFGFPFGCPEAMKEVMRTWCSFGPEMCNCRAASQTTKEERGT